MQRPNAAISQDIEQHALPSTPTFSMPIEKHPIIKSHVKKSCNLPLILLILFLAAGLAMIYLSSKRFGGHMERGEAKVHPVTYLDVDFTNSENLKLNRVRGLCKIFLSTYYLFNFDEKSSSYVSPTVIGADGVVGSKYTHWKKIEKTYQFLTGRESNYIDDHDIIVFSDATDVLFINNIRNIKQVYENYYVKELSKIDLKDSERDWPVVFIAETNKWPPNDFIQNMFVKTPTEEKIVEKHYYDTSGYIVKDNCASANKRIYLNSGLYVGRKRDIRKVLSIGLNVKRGEPDHRIEDQALMQFVYTTNKYPIYVDCEKKMFYSSFAGCDSVVSNPEKKWGCSIQDGNSETPESAVYVHSNGGFCYSLCNCFTSMKQKGLFKNLMEQYKEKMSFKSYDINNRQVRNIMMNNACGHFVDEDFPSQFCNAQPA